MSKPIFPIIPRKTPVLDVLRGQKAGDDSETLDEAQKRLAEDFRRGLASALGVPPEAIRQDLVENWIVGWTRAVVDPAFLGQAEEFGRALGQILPGRGAGSVAPQRDQSPAVRPQTNKTESHISSDISPVDI